MCYQAIDIYYNERFRGFANTVWKYKGGNYQMSIEGREIQCPTSHILWFLMNEQRICLLLRQASALPLEIISSFLVGSNLRS